MPGVAINGSQIQQVTAPNHVSYKIWDPCLYKDSEGNCVGGYRNYTTSATIRGTVIADSQKVYVNNNKIALIDNYTQETETYSVPPDAEQISSDGGGYGRITTGNTRKVYANNKLVATIGCEVTTHAGVKTTILTGSSNVIIGA